MDISLFFALLLLTIPCFMYAFIAKETADKMLFSVLAIALCVALGASCLTLEMVDSGTVIDISNGTVGIVFMAFAVAPAINVYRYMFI